MYYGEDQSETLCFPPSSKFRRPYVLCFLWMGKFKIFMEEVAIAFVVIKRNTLVILDNRNSVMCNSQ